MREDSELVIACQRGDPEAFRLLVERYEDRIYNLACSIVGDREAAQDAAQEAFIKAYRALPRFRGESGFFTWLYRIAVNVCLNQARRQSRRPEAFSLDELVDEHKLSADKFSSSETPLSDFERVELRQTIDTVLAGLSPDHRMAVVLKDVEGYSQEEIAEMMGCSVGTVKSRLSRARARLQELLRPMYEEWIEGKTP